ncbi:MAG: pyruvate kinase [Chloroflexota bacterium]
MRRTKIICTIGPASREIEIIRQLIRAGMDVARLNFSHGDAHTHRENVERIRAASKAEGRPVAIQADLQGPKFRMGSIIDAGVPVKEGDTVTLTTRNRLGESPAALPVQNEALPGLVHAGDRILIDDGLIELRVLATDERQVRCRVITGGVIKSKKGMNLPRVSVDLPAITEKDCRDVAQALAWGVDWIALSFVRRAADVHALKKFIQSQAQRPAWVMAKIEKPQALERLEEIIDAADAVMVARGDLGVEILTERVPVVQKRIIERCNETGVPVVTATQMLDSMIRNPRPTRAEASDVANAILDGTDAVMLSGETAIGQYPLETLQTMVRIIGEVEKECGDIPVRPFRPLQEDVTLSIARAVAGAARQAAANLHAAAIIAITASGYTARIVSRYRPDAPIFAVTPDERVQRMLKLCWGVYPLLAPRTENTDEMIGNALVAAQEHGLLHVGDLVVITTGTAGSQPGTTNLMRIHQVVAPSGGQARLHVEVEKVGDVPLPVLPGEEKGT